MLKNSDLCCQGHRLGYVMCTMKNVALFGALLLSVSAFAATTTVTTTTTTVVTPPTKPVVVSPKVVVTPQVNKKPEVQHKCDDKNKSVVKVAPVTTAKTGTCNKK